MLLDEKSIHELDDCAKNGFTISRNRPAHQLARYEGGKFGFTRDRASAASRRRPVVSAVSVELDNFQPRHYRQPISFFMGEVHAQGLWDTQSGLDPALSMKRFLRMSRWETGLTEPSSSIAKDQERSRLLVSSPGRRWRLYTAQVLGYQNGTDAPTRSRCEYLPVNQRASMYPYLNRWQG